MNTEIKSTIQSTYNDRKSHYIHVFFLIKATITKYFKPIQNSFFQEILNVNENMSK